MQQKSPSILRRAAMQTVHLSPAKLMATISFMLIPWLVHPGFHQEPIDYTTLAGTPINHGPFNVKKFARL
ncbi:MAG: hypothetical protein KDD78_14200, partial [Caldilineaceae bacterium]|nr:hypothetical protein [Caldilineaceae bacterium]